MDTLGLNTSVSIHIMGQPRAGGLIRVNGLNVQLTPVPFHLFMRLVVARFESEGGWVAAGTLKGGGGLANEGFYKPESLNQAWKRMRDPFAAALRGISTTDLFKLESGQGRISTLRSRITWDASLLNSGDEKTKELARRLNGLIAPLD
jgi:hypothetical protein